MQDELLNHAQMNLCTPEDFVRFQRRGNGKANRLFSSAFVSNNEIGGHGIKVAIHTLHGSIKRLQVNGDIGAVGH